MTFSDGRPRITIIRHPLFHRWRWHMKAANGLKIGRHAQGNGFCDRRDAIANLEEVLGGLYSEGYRIISPENGRLYCQGELTRYRNVDGAPVEERIFVAVLG